jgi:hypothetical protein
MHTLHVDGGYLVHHNGDFSGTVEIFSPSTATMYVPFHVLAAIVAEKIRADRIETLEQADTDDLLK